MSTWMHPTGPESPMTYWRRRAFALLVVLAAITLLWRLVSALFSGSTNQTVISATPQNSPDPSLSVGATPSGSASATPGASSAAPSGSSSASVSSTSASASATPSASAPSTPSEPAACRASDLSADIAGKSNFKVGTGGSWVLELTNKGAQACVLDLGRTPLRVSIASGGVGVWSTDHCGKWTPSAKALVKPGAKTSIPLSWNMKASSAGCKVASANAMPGAYVMTAAMDGLSTSHTILLHW